MVGFCGMFLWCGNIIKMFFVNVCFFVKGDVNNPIIVKIIIGLFFFCLLKCSCDSGVCFYEVFYFVEVV